MQQLHAHIWRQTDFHSAFDTKWEDKTVASFHPLDLSHTMLDSQTQCQTGRRNTPDTKREDSTVAMRAKLSSRTA